LKRPQQRLLSLSQNQLQRLKKRHQQKSLQPKRLQLKLLSLNQLQWLERLKCKKSKQLLIQHQQKNLNLQQKLYLQQRRLQ